MKALALALLLAGCGGAPFSSDGLDTDAGDTRVSPPVGPAGPTQAAPPPDEDAAAAPDARRPDPTPAQDAAVPWAPPPDAGRVPDPACEARCSTDDEVCTSGCASLPQGTGAAADCGCPAQLAACQAGC